jgi:hypothetical protein
VTQLTSETKSHDYLVGGVLPGMFPLMALWLRPFPGEVLDHDVCAPSHPERVFLELMHMDAALAPNDVVARPYRRIRKDIVLPLDLVRLYCAIRGFSLPTTDAVSIWGFIIRA